MATTRGFVERIEVGRGGLVKVGVVEGDASRSTYVVSDIDGDPERFNERLTKVAVLRDAMNRAEPVEIEHVAGEFGREIERVARISRDALDPPITVEQVSGLVLQVVVQSRNALQGAAEAHDDAQVFVLGLDGSVVALRLDLQAPERLVAKAQLEVITDAHARGTLCRFLVNRPNDAAGVDILAVAAGDAFAGDRDQRVSVSAFVESLGLILPSGGGLAAAALAATRVTTAPEFTGPGGTLDPGPFTPVELELYVAKGSLTYQLVEAGLRDNLRMRLAYLPIKGRDPKQDKPAEKPSRKKKENEDEQGGAVVFRDASYAAELAKRYGSYVEGSEGGAAEGSPTRALLLAAELLAPLASASRPVWIRIDREMLDRGPEAECVPGLPSSSLKTQTLRDLRIPYPAQWIGLGCFNHGVYRFQLTAPPDATLRVGGDEICLYATADDGTRAGYACVDGDALVTVEIPAYTCDTEFDLDVYRIR